MQWVARDSESSFISCSISQQSTHQDLRDCLTPAGKFSLTEDLQRGNLSLRIRSAQFQDHGKYFCQVKIQGKRQHEQIELHVGEFVLTVTSSQGL